MSQGFLELNSLEAGQHMLQTVMLGSNETERKWRDELMFEVPKQGSCNFSTAAESSDMYNPEQHGGDRHHGKNVPGNQYDNITGTTMPKISASDDSKLYPKLTGPPTPAATVAPDATVDVMTPKSPSDVSTVPLMDQAGSSGCSKQRSSTDQWSGTSMAVIVVLAVLAVILIALNIVQFVMGRRARRPVTEGIRTDSLRTRGFKAPKLAFDHSAPADTGMEIDPPAGIGSYLDVLANGRSVDATVADVIKRRPSSRPISIRPDSLLEVLCAFFSLAPDACSKG